MTCETTLLFVYGTLRQGADHSAHQLLKREAKLIARGYMRGRLYEIDDYPGAVWSEAGNDQVVGELYQLLEADSLLETLDDYEEAGENYPEPREYKRCRVTVEREDKTKVVAWCYLYNRPTAGLRSVVSGDWCE
ncbi:hypothetical protein A7E78_12000 [Syntrophotalea acetylenivorans]|uniref:Gamma-glutamylcyclotransferase AIG2-like domain-containing protein n=1 Tax=Syntrophotalea acetylenivorans TaxID=1842532 RepID=A0A1L3GS61_9BACT|nr:gamma-glutamylcyclotransferase family protein [Syntrophotalea acetylenivorans]APG28498.1 hypothetical protein A7E78_12000 [Syntrophotalea acetylenivorans]